MKSKATIVWLMIVVALAATIWILNNYFQPATPKVKPLFAGLRTDQVTDVDVTPGAGHEISVIRTNNSWKLDKPIAYPAQSAAIDGLLDALQKVTPVMTFSPGELNAHKNADAEFGFDNPQYTLNLVGGGQKWHLRVGNKTAPGDGVYVRLEDTPGAFVTDTSWLQFLPHEANDWRDTTLAEVPGSVNWLVITNGTQAIELRHDVTNRLWRMIRPLQSRANNLLIVSALGQLSTAKILRFVSDDPKPDLASYGLDPAALDVWLGEGTNFLTAIHVGKEVTNMTGEVYARREGLNAIVTTPKEPLAPWRGSVNDFRDPNLFELTAPVAEIEVRGPNNFTMQQRGTNAWAEAGEKFSVDLDLARVFVQSLASLRIADFAQDVVTPSGLQNFGLASPPLQITLRSATGDTNSVIAQLLFGTTNNNKQIYVKRGDEDFVYAIDKSKYDALPWTTGDYFRDRHAWNFSETNVAQVTLHQNGKTRTMIRNGTNDWSLAAGSQGIINTPEVEETVHRLGQLTVEGWLGRKFNDDNVGLSTNNLSITVELKSGEKYTLDFGREVLKQTALAVTTLDGERWAFVFPPALLQLVAESLTIPANTP
jgi:hypothetical protein